MNPPTTQTVDQNYFKSPTEDLNAYNSRIQNYNASKTPTSDVGNPASTTLAQDQAKTANQGKPGYDLFGNTDPNYKAPIAAEPKTTAQTLNDKGTELQTAQNELQTHAKTAIDAIDSIRNGATPLSAGQTAQIDGLKNQYEQLIQDQQDQNDQDRTAQNLMDARQGRTQYMPMAHLQTISTIATKGRAKISDLQIKEASAIAALTEGFKTSNIADIKDAYELYKGASKEKTDAIQKYIDDSQKAIKDANDAKIAADKVVYDTVTKPIQDIQADVLKNTGDAQLAASIGKANNVEAALALAGDSMQVGTGTLGDYLAYKRQVVARGGTPINYDAFVKHEEDKGVDLAYRKAYATAKGDAAGKTAGLTEGTISTDETAPVTSDGTGQYTKDQALSAITKMKLSESQSNAVSYALRMMESNKAINNLIGENYNPTTSIASIGRLFRSDNARTLDRDLQNFIRAQLRKESGAQISDGEIAGGKKIYDPSGVLTNAKDVQQTADTRQQAIQSMIAQAGPAGKVLNEYFKSIGTGGNAGLSPGGAALIEDDAAAKSKLELIYPSRSQEIDSIITAKPDISNAEILQVLGQ